MNCVFQIFTAVSGSPSLEESYIGTHASGIAMNPFALEKGEAPGWISLLQVLL